MGLGKAIRAGLQNGGRKTVVGGICAGEYDLSKEDMKHIARHGMSDTKGKAKKK